MSNPINDNSNSIIEILVAQCQDLEKLLVLAKQETLVLQKNDFEQLFIIIKERATLSSRLELYHKQLADLRSAITQNQVTPENIVNTTVDLVSAIQTQYAQNGLLLLEAKEKLFKERQQLEQTRRGVDSYLHSYNPTSVAYDHHL